MNVLITRSELGDSGPGTQGLEMGRVLRQRGHAVVFASSPHVLDSEIAAEAFTHYRIPTLAVERRDSVSTMINVLEFRRIIRRHRIDVVHGLNAAATFCAWAGGVLSLRRPVVLQSVHGIELRDSHQWRNLVYRYHPGWILATSEFTERELLRLGAPLARVRQTWNGVSTSTFDPSIVSGEAIRREFSIPASATLLGHVGVFYGLKGQDRIVRTVATLRQRGLDVFAIMVGDGKYRKPTERLAGELGVAPFVRFPGLRRDIPQFQAAFDIYTQPSIRGEMLPVAIIEAMAMENPWVGSDLSGLAELADESRTGLISSPQDLDAFIANVERLVRDPHLRRTMGERARELVKKKFSIEAVVDRFEPLYGQRPPRAHDA